jgi:MFS superfamily sulfate permease-like transporter
MRLKRIPPGWIRFDRNEWAGSFGDIGTDLPLIVAMVVSAGLDSASVFIMFGLVQVLTGVLYGLPMPMQPLKAMAVLVISQKLSGAVLYGGGLAVGATMLLLTLTGGLGWLARRIPRCAVRGVQMGLGLSLAGLALKNYVPAMGAAGYALAGVCFVVTVLLWGNRRIPAALLVVLLGAAYAAVFHLDVKRISDGVGLALPQPRVPALSDILTGFLVLALPQIPLSISNSVIATRQALADLFPARGIQIRKIGLTYSVANLILPFFSGIPVCHGCGGLAGHYAFGARTGGSVVLYGTMYLLLGLFFSRVSDQVVQVFPLPVLGVVLLFEAVVLILFVRDIAGSRRDLTIAVLTALLAFALPQGFLVGLVVGTLLYYASERWPILKGEHP